MANLKNIYDLNVDLVSEDARFEEEITSHNGKLATYDDNSAIGFLEDNSEITHVLAGAFVPDVGLRLASINVNDLYEDLSIYTTAPNNFDNDHWHGTLQNYNWYGFNFTGFARSTATPQNAKGTISKDVLSKYEQALNSLAQNSQKHLNYLNKFLNEFKDAISFINTVKNSYAVTPVPEPFSEEDPDQPEWW